VLLPVVTGLTSILVPTPTPASADRFISADLGYFSTTSSKYGSGFVYGVGLTEGTGKVGVGITALRFGDSHKGAEVTVIDGKIYKAEFEEDVADLCLTIMALYRLNDPKEKNHVMACAGPQVHFLNSRRAFSTFTEAARDFRLGAGAVFRYQRRIDMFGMLGFVTTVSYSHMQSVASRTDQYEVPTRAMNVTTVTAGLAFPF
jgi:hypothetical protein